MKLKNLIDYLEQIAPASFQESYDNSGLIVGDAAKQIKGVLICLDSTEEIVDEAIALGCNVIIAHHPIVFRGIKKFNGKNYVERVVMKAIKNDIAIYATHTALDNSQHGVNAKICEVLGIENPKILIPQKKTIKKLTTYVPKKDVDKVKAALFEAGAGSIGNYDHCSFINAGTGSFRAGVSANPSIGETGEIHFEDETQIHITYQKSQEQKVLNALFKNHPYEEVAYEVYSLENTNQHIGMGMIGSLKKSVDQLTFLNHVKQTMHAEGIKHSKLIEKPVQKVAVLGGSGAFAIAAAKAAGADVFITADVKYHQFYEAEDQMVIADIGHFETEQFTKNLLVDYLTKKIPNFAIRLAESKTNPIKYL